MINDLYRHNEVIGHQMYKYQMYKYHKYQMYRENKSKTFMQGWTGFPNRPGRFGHERLILSSFWSKPQSAASTFI